MEDSPLPIRPIEEVVADISALMPQMIDMFHPANAAEQRAAFMAGTIRNPSHEYPAMDAFDADEVAEKLDVLERELSACAIRPVYADAYGAFAATKHTRLAFFRAALGLRHASTDQEKEQASQEFMRLNIEQFGAPDERAHNAMLAKVRRAATGNANADAALHSELLAMVPEGTADAEAFKPSEEAKEWITNAALELMDPLLRHIPRHAKDDFTPAETARLFRYIITQAFGEAAADWTVELGDVDKIHVDPARKHVAIPIGAKPITPKHMRGLVAHELGVHMLRAVAGGETDLPLLQTGLFGNADMEEGLASIIQRIVEGEDSTPEDYSDLTFVAGLMYYQKMDFRDCFELLWRYKAIQKDTPATEKDVESARQSAYGIVFRNARGTDTLPWFKDLRYFNSRLLTWRYLEQIAGDDLRLWMLFAGKSDSARPDHRRVVLETRPRAWYKGTHRAEVTE